MQNPEFLAFYIPFTGVYHILTLIRTPSTPGRSFFGEWRLLSNDHHYDPLKPCKFSEKSNGLFSGKFEKCQFLAQNDYIWAQYLGKRFFAEWGLLSNDYHYEPLKSYNFGPKMTIFGPSTPEQDISVNEDYYQKITIMTLYKTLQIFRKI